MLEHVTTEDTVAYARSADTGMAATITPPPLINRNAIFQRGLEPHMYCQPVAKRERHRQAFETITLAPVAVSFPGTRQWGLWSSAGYFALARTGSRDPFGVMVSSDPSVAELTPGPPIPRSGVFSSESMSLDNKAES